MEPTFPSRQYLERFNISRDMYLLTILILPSGHDGRHEDEDEEGRDLHWPRRGHPKCCARCEVTSLTPGLTAPCDGLSLTLDSEHGPGLGTSAASGVRGQARPGLPCNRAPARGPSPQLIKVKQTKKHEHCQEIQKALNQERGKMFPV